MSVMTPQRLKPRKGRSRSSCPPFLSSSKEATRTINTDPLARGGRRYAIRCGFVGHASLGERRHAGVAGQRRAQDQHRERRARRLTKSHVEIEQRTKPKFIEQHAMAGFGGNMTG